MDTTVAIVLGVSALVTALPRWLALSVRVLVVGIALLVVAVHFLVVREMAR